MFLCIYCTQAKTLDVKKAWPSKVEPYLVITRSDIRMWPRLSINTTFETLYIAS